MFKITSLTYITIKHQEDIREKGGKQTFGIYNINISIYTVTYVISYNNRPITKLVKLFVLWKTHVSS